MKNLYLLGATGSIGSQVLQIVDANPTAFAIVTLGANENVDGMSILIEKYHPQYVAMGDSHAAVVLQMRHPEVQIGSGEAGLVQVATWNPEDREGLMVNALVGMCGLVPTVKTIEIGRNIALANKETLVIGGGLILPLCKKHHVNLLPIDSEHSALWQCLQGEDVTSVKRLIITASGGAFRDKTREELRNVTIEDALHHPNWTMGSKITIDSATMMNKGFEVIEAHYLFGISADQIETLLHKESYVHSLVEFIDGSLIAQLSDHDMRLPIAYALFHPVRMPNLTKPLDLAQIASLTFTAMDYDRFPCLAYAYEALRKGGVVPCVMNAANEAAVRLFLNHKIAFLEIEHIIRSQMDLADNLPDPTLEDLVRVDQVVKEKVNLKYLK
jgi:1-deoxy-D-xylulose-5-phosphate reductoisomerase